ncbi:MAG: aldehyde dehydrogenase family protein [Calditrichaeota bacterium]|nr:aldehyde dehydrogenase family protein [Calditrichota bacterium]
MPIISGNKIQTCDVRQIKSPWTREPVGECAFAGSAEIEAALEAGQKATSMMRSLRNYQRADILHQAADLLAARREQFARTIALEAGKPIRDARAEATRAASTFRLAAEYARSQGGEVLPLDITSAGGERLALVRRFPLGLVTGISPFNFPLNLVAHKVAPAIAAGCAINLKPASYTPLTALMLGELLLEAGLPPGAFNVLPAPANLAGPLIEDARVKLVTFTGSAEVGWSLKQRGWPRRVCLELGGNAAALIEPDCDLDWAVKRCATGGYAYQGQVCISVQHILIDEGIYDSFRERFVPAVEELKMGDPLDETTDIAAMIDEKEAKRIMEWLAEAVNLGARLLCGGEREANRVQPTAVENVPDKCRLSWEEAFAPVTILSKYRRFEEAVERVNGWQFGLQTGIFTKNIEKALLAFNRLEVGGVIVNDAPTLRVDNYPYGGVKNSGFGREGVKYAMEEMSELKTLVLPAPK